MSRIVAALLLGLLAPFASAAVAADLPVEDYASYVPQKTCHDRPRAGTAALAAWLEREWSGTKAVASVRRCRSGGASEHKDGRAIDWMLQWRKEKERAKAKALIERLLATDDEGNHAALARRMGVMYLIWNDHIYASYDQFAKRDYLSSGCRTKKKCSVTLRHRDHVHISLSKPGGKGRTSFYQVP